MTMAFKLTKDESKTRGEIAETLEKHWAAVESAVGIYNAEVEVAKEKVNTAISAFNDVAGTAASFVEEVATRASTEFDERSEKWQEGDNGQSASSWKDEWEGFDCEGVEVDWPDELSIDQPNVVDLASLPEEAE